jgi:tetratricopeptide (TPR) repeat protein
LIGRPDEAMITGRRALALGEEIGDTDLQIVSRSYIGQTHYNLGEYQQSAAAMRALLREIEPLAPDRRFGLPLPGQVLFRCWLIWALSRLGLTSEVNGVIVEVLKAAAAVDQPLSQTVARHSSGFGLVNGDRIDEAIPHLEAALSLCRRWRLLAWFNDIASCLGYAYARADRGDEGLELLEEAVRQSRSLGVMSGHALEVAWLAEAQLIANSVEDAAANARAAVALARQYRERGNEAYALWLLGRIGLQSEPVDHSGIGQLVRAALDVAGGSGMQPLITKCHGVLTKLQQRLGDSHEVSTRATPAAHTG